MTGAVERIAIVRLSAFGDVVFALPSLAALRDARPRARITWIVDERFAPLLRAVPEIDEVLPLPLRAFGAAGFSLRRRAAAVAALARAAKELRARRFDLVFDLQGNLKSGVVSRLTGAPVRVGLPRGEARELNWLFSTRAAPVDAPVHRSDRDLGVLAAAGVAAPFRRPAFVLPPADVAAAEAIVARAPGGRGPFVIVHPGTSAFMPHKRWPADRHAALARRLKDAYDARVLLTWGKDDEAVAADVAARSGGAAAMSPDLPTPAALAAVLRRAALVVGGDTGPVHLADALGVPVVAIFGPTDPRLYHPHGRPDRALYRRVHCSPCRFRACPERICLDEISVDEAFAACAEALGPPPARAV